MAEKVRTWFRQLFEYAMVVVPAMENSPARDLHVVAVPLPPVQHNPFLRMAELPSFLRTLRTYQGRRTTQLATRLLLLTGVRTGELRLATPDQFDLDRGLWLIPVASLKQHKMLSDFKPAQKYLFAGVVRLTDRMSENTVNFALKRMGYDGRLTGHGLRATMSTALNEVGYPRVWVDAQLSHADPNRISAIYNHAQYVERKRPGNAH